VNVRHTAILSVAAVGAAGVWAAVVATNPHHTSPAPHIMRPAAAVPAPPTAPPMEAHAGGGVSEATAHSTIQPGQRPPAGYTPAHPTNTPASVASAVISTSYGYDTRVDTSERDAALRTTSWLTHRDRQQLALAVVRNTPDWARWTSHAAHAQVQLHRIRAIGGDVTDPGVLVSYHITVTMTGHHWTDRSTTTVTATCQKRHGVWLVDRLDVL
jgi:hypothetical protein